MLSASRCREQSGLEPREAVAMLSLKQKQLLASYLLNLQTGERFVFELMVSDIQRLVDLGAQALATDVLVALRIFMRDRPQFNAFVRRSRAFEGLYGIQSTRRTLDSLVAASGARQTQSAIRTEWDKQSLA
jgi:hypothetical protein